VIDRAAILNLSAAINDGRIVMITLDTGLWFTVEEIVGVQAESHAIVQSDGRTMLIPLAKIALIEIANNDDEVLLEA